jgi:6,7-dimethyl-8-ribityllumazine synthase
MAEQGKRTILEGQLDARGLRVALVVARFNTFISERLLEGALDALARHGAADADVSIARVPGAFELPLAVKRLVGTGRFDAIVALGAVIRGSTPHFDYVAAESSKGVAEIALKAGLPVIYGILTTDTIEQAVERAGTKAGNRGYDAAIAAIEMASLRKKLKS